MESLVDLTKVMSALNDLRKKYQRTTEVEIGGVVFELSTLSESKDRETVKLSGQKMDGETFVTFGRQVRVRTLANAITKVNGDAVPDIIEMADKTTKTKIDYLVPILDSMSNAIVDILWEAHEALDKEVKESLSGVIEEKKSAISEDEKNPVALPDVEGIKTSKVIDEEISFVEGTLDQLAPDLERVPTAEEIGVEFTDAPYDTFGKPPVKFKEGVIPEPTVRKQGAEAERKITTSARPATDAEVFKRLATKPVKVQPTVR